MQRPKVERQTVSRDLIHGVRQSLQSRTPATSLSRAHSNLLLNLTLRYPFPETRFSSNPLCVLFRSFFRPAHRRLLLLLPSTHQRDRVPTALNPVSAPLMTNVCLISVRSLDSAWSIAWSRCTHVPDFVHIGSNSLPKYSLAPARRYSEGYPVSWRLTAILIA